jgi:hypothetical protein
MAHPKAPRTEPADAEATLADATRTTEGRAPYSAILRRCALTHGPAAAQDDGQDASGDCHCTRLHPWWRARAVRGHRAPPGALGRREGTGPAFLSLTSKTVRYSASAVDAFVAGAVRQNMAQA